MDTTDGRIPDGWVLARKTAIKHPSNMHTGHLMRNPRTGVYAMLSGGSIVAVPRIWAVEHATQ